MDKKEALLCSKICRLTYVDKYDFKDFQLTARFENKATDTQGLFGVAYDNTAVIAFRGSEETGITDWITDLKFVQQVYPYGENSKNIKVHYGFIDAYKSVRDAVLKEAKSTPHKRILLTGHSLGGALAMLAALDIQYNQPDKDIVCYTLGSPKVGNAEFVKSYNKRVPKTFRIVNVGDSVPGLPPLGDYDHCGELCEVGESLSTTLMDVAAKIKAHIPNTYIELLQKLK